MTIKITNTDLFQERTNNTGYDGRWKIQCVGY